jgi:aryl-alcohol dehydrogenase-like predicted oxidoreductase
MSLKTYRQLGRSGLIVSPAALGTMTFGRDGWGSDDDVSGAVFDAYVEAGGNFIDTAEVYSGGRSEELVGTFIADRRLRDRMVIATKFGWNGDPGNPNFGGNGAKNVMRAVEGSLRRLGTDYIDLYWLHVWDTITPVEEVLRTFGALVTSGKIRYFGLSNAPAWYAAKMATLAEVHGVPGPIALQLEYSLIARAIESEQVGAARECGLAITPWSPLGGGFLSGKYSREAEGVVGEGRLAGANPFSGPFSKFTDRNWKILDALKAVAAEVGRTCAQVALAWVAARPGVASSILGARSVEQLHDTLAGLALNLTPAQTTALDTASMLEPDFMSRARSAIFGGVDVQARAPR